MLCRPQLFFFFFLLMRQGQVVRLLVFKTMFSAIKNCFSPLTLPNIHHRIKIEVIHARKQKKTPYEVKSQPLPLLVNVMLSTVRQEHVTLSTNILKYNIAQFHNLGGLKFILTREDLVCIIHNKCALYTRKYREKKFQINYVSSPIKTAIYLIVLRIEYMKIYLFIATLLEQK